ncbi:hypothetical protein [Legionella cincinnatiensis]|uniref:Uncharacterized protein n=1 Tax=Legionella cincinnatiensis TaxID=28085 RepID=A0A378IDY2_9GAMM|nr:hypothetical protein [Legionella cincinnatiensis]KTC92258.1 hypothetical protein Lcin_1037 [Legionella cincinnatiensis]STX33437.1 Uncharacterised protein [Legionella cincinnatiensis]
MKKILVYLCLNLMASGVFGSNIVLENKTDYPEKGKLGKIAVQWAVSAKAIQKANKSILNGSTFNSSSLVMLSQKGKIQLITPNDARYFRLVAWSNDNNEPEFLTNWVDIVPNKTYVVNQNQLVPRVLMAGAGC